MSWKMLIVILPSTEDNNKISPDVGSPQQTRKMSFFLQRTSVVLWGWQAIGNTFSTRSTDNSEAAEPKWSCKGHSYFITRRNIQGSFKPFIPFHGHVVLAHHTTELYLPFHSKDIPIINIFLGGPHYVVGIPRARNEQESNNVLLMLRALIRHWVFNTVGKQRQHEKIH